MNFFRCHWEPCPRGYASSTLQTLAYCATTIILILDGLKEVAASANRFCITFILRLVIYTLRYYSRETFVGTGQCVSRQKWQVNIAELAKA